MRFRIARLVLAASAALAALPVEAQTDADLVRAYQKEFAFLEAEKRALQDRLAEVERTADQQTAAARAEVQRLQARTLTLQRQADQLERDLYDADQEAAQSRDREDVLAETFHRMRRTFEDAGLAAELPEKVPDDPEAAASAVLSAFDGARTLMERGGSVRREAGAFFLPDGGRVEGQVVHVGEVASYGLSGDRAGALAPVGGGRLKLWNEEAAHADAVALAQGERPETLDLFLYESLEKPVAEPKVKTPLEVVQSGGVIAWVIVFLGLGALLMILARLFILSRAGSRMEHIVAEVSPLVAQGRIDAALEHTRASKGVAARLLTTTIRHLDKDRDHLEDIVSEAILHEAPALERFGSTIAVFAAVAPLLGLLGTVTGMISTFDVITEYGTGDPKLLSGGISEALVTTELGLIVAIPTLLIGTLLSGRASAIQAGLERAALHVMNLATRRRYTEPEVDQDADEDGTPALPQPAGEPA